MYGVHQFSNLKTDDHFKFPDPIFIDLCSKLDPKSRFVSFIVKFAFDQNFGVKSIKTKISDFSIFHASWKDSFFLFSIRNNVRLIFCIFHLSCNTRDFEPKVFATCDDVKEHVTPIWVARHETDWLGLSLYVVHTNITKLGRHSN